MSILRTQISSDEESLPAAQKTVMKVDMTRDLLTIFSEKVSVRFVHERGKIEERGRWCSICRCVFIISVDERMRGIDECR